LWIWDAFNSYLLRKDMHIGVPYKIMDSVALASVSLYAVMAIKMVSGIKDMATADIYSIVLKNNGILSSNYELFEVGFGCKILNFQREDKPICYVKAVKKGFYSK